MAGPLLTDNKIILLDLGGQGNYLVARRVRALKVYAEILPGRTTLECILAAKPLGVILVGQPTAQDEAQGMQLIASLLGARLPLLALGEWPRQAVATSGGTLIEQKGAWPTEDMSGKGRAVYSLTALPTTDDDPGMEIWTHFIYDVCKCQPTWTMEAFIDHCVESIRQGAGDAPVICGLSGGVDSTVAAALVHRAIGDQLHTVFVNNGFMRKHEVEEVIEVFEPFFGDNFVAVDASARFLQQVTGVVDPEAKRKIIGAEFIRVFEEEAAKIGSIEYLVQGTVYPDVVESGAGDAALVKSHHNVGGLPEEMELGLIEPLRWLFKEEVREVGELLGLPDDLVWRQPFPGPGLAVRVIGEITSAKLDILREADFILRDEIKRAGLDREIWQYFAVLTGVRTVGVQEQQRAYGYTVGIRAVHSTDGMLASWAHIPFEVLERISQRIMAEVKDVNRVVYDISSKPPATIEWE